MRLWNIVLRLRFARVARAPSSANVYGATVLVLAWKFGCVGFDVSSVGKEVQE
jgi:hypothetical protein